MARSGDAGERPFARAFDGRGDFGRDAGNGNVDLNGGSAQFLSLIHILLSQLPGVNVSVISVNVATAEGRIGGESGAQRNSVRVQVGDGTTLNEMCIRDSGQHGLAHVYRYLQ